MQKFELSVTQLNNYIKAIFDNEEILFNIGVFGEVTNFKISNGNAYFDIKDDAATLSCLKFGAAGLDIKNGDKVVLAGRLNFAPKYGRLSFIVSSAKPYGMGELYEKFLALKAKLETEGIFDERYKKAIPKYAKRIGVVTSETGAVIHDIINVARRKNPYVDIVLFPVKVQGEGAETQIAEGIRTLDGRMDIDTIIVARGGGSFEDLAPFNTETVARAVFECTKPIVSGVGHETDFSLCDFAADLRVPTPSVASEVCVFDFFEEVARIKNYLSRAGRAIVSRINLEKKGISSALLAVLNRVSGLITGGEKQQLAYLRRIENALDDKLSGLKKQTELVCLRLEKSNPLSILKAGYAGVTVGAKKVTSVKNVAVGDELNLTLADGTILAKTISVKEKKL